MYNIQRICGRKITPEYIGSNISPEILIASLCNLLDIGKVKKIYVGEECKILESKLYVIIDHYPYKSFMEKYVPLLCPSYGYMSEMRSLYYIFNCRLDKKRYIENGWTPEIHLAALIFNPITITDISWNGLVSAYSTEQTQKIAICAIISSIDTYQYIPDIYRSDWMTLYASQKFQIGTLPRIYYKFLFRELTSDCVYFFNGLRSWRNDCTFKFF